MIPLFISSKNRASQLRLLLESLDKNCSGLFEVTILYSSGNDSYHDGYKKLQNESIIDTIQWQKEDEGTNGLFIRQFYDFLNHSSDHFALMVDDNIFYRKTSMTEDRIKNILDEDTFCFQFRLGANTTIQDHLRRTEQTPLEQGDIKEDHVRWKYTERAGKFEDYALPFSWDGVVYRTGDVLDALENTDFSSTDHAWAPLPHRLEEYMWKNANKFSHRSCMTAPKESCVVGMDYNKVINVANKGGHKFRANEKSLNDLYLKGMVIDLESMDFSGVKSAHEEIPFKMKGLV